MFLSFGKSCWDWEPESRKASQQRKLKFLKWMRDDLETRLAGLNAAIDTVERQLSQEDISSS
ncbi:MAG: hypothetical protein ACRC8A_01175 [Microcoleaceae cyanobacterium]